MNVNPQLLNLGINIIPALIFAVIVIMLFHFMVKPNLPDAWSDYTRHAGNVYVVILLATTYGSFQTAGPRLTLDVRHSERPPTESGEVQSIKPENMLDRDRTIETRNIIEENAID